LFSPVSSTNKTDCHDIDEILLKVAFNTINQTKLLKLNDVSEKKNPMSPPNLSQKVLKIFPKSSD